MKLFKKVISTNQDLIKKIGNKIYFGPFSGLKIPEQVETNLSTSEILGLYESCLHQEFNYLLNKEIKNIIVVGGNNGYYSAGLNYLFNPNSIIVYETDINFHNKIDSWFLLNELKNYSIFGEANNEEFVNINSKIDFVFMDCEGFEIELLDPIVYTWQENVSVLLELHPFYVKNLIATLSDKFRNTHKIKLVYDDFDENKKIDEILKGFNLEIQYPSHPSHRWIIENDKKVFTSGIFMVLTPK